MTRIRHRKEKKQEIVIIEIKIELNYCFEPFNQLYTHSTFVEILSKLKVDNGKTCDLKRLPTEVGIKVLKYLDATGK